jgi:glutaredoxin-related protein
VTGREVKTVPQIYIEGEYIGGYDELMEHFNKPLETTEDDECRACEG